MLKTEYTEPFVDQGQLRDDLAAAHRWFAAQPATGANHAALGRVLAAVPRLLEEYADLAGKLIRAEQARREGDEP